jgi:hypothetical protein
MIRFLLALLALAFALPLSPPASAHQQKTAITIVEHNPRSDMLEVVHRIPLHDAEHALKLRGDPAPDVIEDLESRRAFVLYAAERFSIVVDGEELELSVIGSEIEGGSIVVYQEGPSPGIGSELTIQSQVLTDIWARQVNRVNVGGGTDPQTLVFTGGEPAKSAVLD